MDITEKISNDCIQLEIIRNNDTEIAEDHDKKPTVNWRNILMRYLWSIFITSFFFGLQIDGKFHRITMCVGFLHFAAELEPIYYLLLSPLAAKRLSIITYFIHTLEAISVWIISSIMCPTFAYQFFFSDSLNFFTSLVFIFHPKINTKLWRICVALSMHYIGVTWAMSISAMVLHYDPEMQDGLGWITIICVSLIQLYLLRPLLTKNEYIEIPKLNLTQKFSIFAGLFLTVIAAFLLNVFRTTTTKHDKECIDGGWADSNHPFEIMVVRIVGPLTAFIGIYGSCYYYKFAAKFNSDCK